MSWQKIKCLTRPLSVNLYTFKNIDKTFNLKAHFTCDSSNLFYVVTCSKCDEVYTCETRIDKTKLRDRVWVYWQHIREPEYQKLKEEDYFTKCGKGTLKVFLLLQMRSSEIDLRRNYERIFMKKYLTKLNYW